MVLGGLIFGMMSGLIKYVVERSKVAEIRNKLWGRCVLHVECRSFRKRSDPLHKTFSFRAFWAFGHVVVNTMHALYVRVVAATRFQQGFRPFAPVI